MTTESWIRGTAFVLVAWTAVSVLAARDLTFDERVRAQEAIERVYWSNRTWPSVNAGAKPPFEALMPSSVIRTKVLDYLKKSTALEKYWERPITSIQLQAEIERMVRDTR